MPGQLALPKPDCSQEILQPQLLVTYLQRLQPVLDCLRVAVLVVDHLTNLVRLSLLDTRSGSAKIFASLNNASRHTSCGKFSKCAWIVNLLVTNFAINL
jgi:hypothetical protein